MTPTMTLSDQYISMIDSTSQSSSKTPAMGARFASTRTTLDSRMLISCSRPWRELDAFGNSVEKFEVRRSLGVDQRQNLVGQCLALVFPRAQPLEQYIELAAARRVDRARKVLTIR